MPPTSIDGTDITGATIDGTDVQEITVDGQTVFTAVDIPQSGLLHSWPISNQSWPISDTVGSNDIAQVAGNDWDTTTETWKDGVAWEGDGVDNEGEGDAILTNEFTVCLWAYVEANDVSATALSNGSQFDSNSAFFPRIRAFPGEFNGWDIALFNGSTFDEVQAGSLNLNQLDLIVARYDGSTLSFVQNTTEVGTTSVTMSNPLQASQKLQLGNESAHFNGYIDWILWYDEFKTNAEIQQIFDAHPST